MDDISIDLTILLLKNLLKEDELRSRIVEVYNKHQDSSLLYYKGRKSDFVVNPQTIKRVRFMFINWFDILLSIAIKAVPGPEHDCYDEVCKILGYRY